MYVEISIVFGSSLTANIYTIIIHEPPNKRRIAFDNIIIIINYSSDVTGRSLCRKRVRPRFPCENVTSERKCGKRPDKYRRRSKRFIETGLADVPGPSRLEVRNRFNLARRKAEGTR